MSRKQVAFVLAFALTLTTNLAGQTPAPQTPPPADRATAPVVVRFPAEGLALVESVRLTLQHSPNIRLQDAAAEFQQGVAQEEGGRFDTTLTSGLTHDYRIQELTESKKRQEREIRDDLREGIAQNLNSVANLRAVLPILQSLSTSTSTTAAQLDVIRRVDPLMATQLELMDTLIRTQPAAASQIQASRQAFLRDAMPPAIAGVQAGLDEFAAQQLRLTRIGEAPFDEVFGNNHLNLEVSRTFRNGLLFSPYFDGGREATNYKDKPTSADFGGKGFLDLFTFHGGANMGYPLLRGRGSVAFAAAERAAIAQTTASRATAQHEHSASALDTIRAYWDLRSSQDAVDIAQRSLQLQTTVRDLTQGLIRAGDLPQIEFARVQASEARAQARLSDATRARRESQVELATVMGVAVTDDAATLPTAGDPFPPVPEPALLEDAQIMALVNQAVADRQDVKAAAQDEAAGQLRYRGAQTEIRPKLDFNGSVFVTALDEGTVGKAVDRWIGPSTNLSLDFEKPFGNNAARGRLQQSESDLRRAQIANVDLRRRTSLDVIRLARTLRDAITRAQQAEQAATFYRSTIDAEVQRLKAGESTLINVILTEDQATQALLTLSAAQRDVASLVAELRFAIGGLVPADAAMLTPQTLITVPRAGQK